MGAKDCYSNRDFHEIITSKEDFYRVKIETEKLAKNLIYSDIEWRPKNYISLKNGEEKEIIRNDLGEDAFNSIINLSDPVAAASIAQVHKAVFWKLLEKLVGKYVLGFAKPIPKRL